jgi:hypothetical protein
MNTPGFGRKITLLLGASALVVATLAACTTVGPTLDYPSSAQGSSNFSLSRPIVYLLEVGAEIRGKVCRKSATTLLSPARVTIENIDRNGALVFGAVGEVDPIYVRTDQRCGLYRANVPWRPVEGGFLSAEF